MKKIKVVGVKKTCIACPAQWEGITDKNRPIYVRYRWGHLSISIGSKDKDIWDAVRGKTIISLSYGGQWDGDMEYNKLVELTKDKIDWPKVESIYNESDDDC